MTNFPKILLGGLIAILILMALSGVIDGGGRSRSSSASDKTYEFNSPTMAKTVAAYSMPGGGVENCQVKAGQLVTIHDRLTTSDGMRYVRIEANGCHGWVRAGHVK